MNYIELINNFWLQRRSKRITSMQADLYFFLLQESNSRNWENPFQCANGIICTSIGISENSLTDARNVLQQRGLIDFESGIKNKKSPVYYLKNCGNNRGNLGGNIRGNMDGKQPNTNTINETKSNQTIKLKFDYRKNLLEKIQDEKLVDDFMLVRKNKKATNSETAFNLLIDECEKNNFSLIDAVRICVEKDWKGFKVQWVKNSQQTFNQNGNTNNSGTNEKPRTIGGIPESQISSLLSNFPKGDN